MFVTVGSKIASQVTHDLANSHHNFLLFCSPPAGGELLCSFSPKATITLCLKKTVLVLFFE